MRFASKSSESASSTTTFDIDEVVLRPVSSESDPLIEEAIKLGKLHVASSQRIEPFLLQIKEDEKINITSQHIMGHSICTPHTDWEFLFDIYFPFSLPVPSDRCDDAPKLVAKHKVYAFATFPASHTQLQRIDDIIRKRMKKGHRYFALPEYPSLHKCGRTDSITNKRGQSLTTQMRKEEEFIVKPTLPRKRVNIFKKAKPAKYKDLKAFARYLHILLSSPSLAQESFIYRELGFDGDLVLILRNFASNRLATWQFTANQPHNIDPSKLLSNAAIYRHYKFHTVYVVRRPLNDASLRLFNHWALKFEGKDHLMTTEFFKKREFEDDEDPVLNGMIKTQVLPNTMIGRRVFWYWWKRDAGDFKAQYFTQQWINGKTIYLGEITLDCIARLLCKWLNTHPNQQYSAVNNNCQHFVRDLTTVLDLKIARELSQLMDHQAVATAIPGASMADSVSTEERIRTMYDILKKELRKYQREQQANARRIRKQKEEKDGGGGGGGGEEEKSTAPDEEAFESHFNNLAEQLGIDIDSDTDSDDDEDESSLQNAAQEVYSDDDPKV